jgi:hypothetical protein
LILLYISLWTSNDINPFADLDAKTVCSSSGGELLVDFRGGEHGALITLYIDAHLRSVACCAPLCLFTVTLIPLWFYCPLPASVRPGV